MVHPPLMRGEIKRHILRKDEWAIFYGNKPKDGAEEVTLNLKSIRGFPKLYYTECETFPKCTYKIEDIKQMTSSYPANRI